MGWTAEYIIKWLEKIAGEGIKSVAPTREAMEEFVRDGDEVHRTLTWTGFVRVGVRIIGLMDG